MSRVPGLTFALSFVIFGVQGCHDSKVEPRSPAHRAPLTTPIPEPTLQLRLSAPPRFTKPTSERLLLESLRTPPAVTTAKATPHPLADLPETLGPFSLSVDEKKRPILNYNITEKTVESAEIARQRE